MVLSYQDISAQAGSRWQSLTAGDKPWVRVGAALCGEAAGAEALLEALTSSLGHHGMEANVSRVGCLGLCFAEPLLDVQFPGGRRIFYGNVTTETLEEIIVSHLSGGNPVASLALGYLENPAAPGWESPPVGISDLNLHPMRGLEKRIALRNAGNIDPGDIYQYLAMGGYEALHKALTTMTPDQTLEEVATAGLRGRGGAAFPAATKWRFLSGSDAPVKYVLCNCEEGDPGA